MHYRRRYRSTDHIAEVLRTKPPRNYLPPSKFEILRMAHKFNLENPSPTLFADLANLFAGGKTLSWEEVEENLRREVESQYPRRFFRQEYTLPNGDKTNDRQVVIDEIVKHSLEYQKTVWEFMSKIRPQHVPGNSPLERAMVLYKLLVTRGGGGQSGNKPLRIFLGGETGEQIANDMEEVADAIEDLDDLDRELLRKRRYLFDPREPEDEAGQGHGKLTRSETTLDIMESDKLLEMLLICRKLEEFSKMKIESETRFTPDPEGMSVRTRQIAGLHELPKVSPESWALYRKVPSLFWYRAATQQLVVRERGMHLQHRQLIYLLIDASGSMAEGRRIYKACGVLMNRLKGVIEKDAELYYRFFDDDVFEEHHVSTEAEARAAMEEVLGYHFSGGGTNITHALGVAVERTKEIVSDKQMIRPEIVVLTDGYDRIGMRVMELGGARLHAFFVAEDNPFLSDLAKDSGGVALYL